MIGSIAMSQACHFESKNGKISGDYYMDDPDLVPEGFIKVMFPLGTGAFKEFRGEGTLDSLKKFGISNGDVTLFVTMDCTHGRGKMYVKGEIGVYKDEEVAIYTRAAKEAMLSGKMGPKPKFGEWKP